MKNKIWLYFTAGISIGLGLGFGVGILQAPDSGERTRRKFMKKAERFKSSMERKKSENGVNA